MKHFESRVRFNIFYKIRTVKLRVERVEPGSSKKKWNQEPNRNPKFLDSPTRTLNRNLEIKADGTGTVRTEIFL